MRILILGVSGMLGHTLFFELTRKEGLAVFGSLRGMPAESHAFFREAIAKGKLLTGVDAYNFQTINAAVKQVKPDVLINCIGLIRQLPEGQKALPCIEINSRLPHLLLGLCRDAGIRLIHYSTDCVFDGCKDSPYTEDDPPSARDIYGLSKYLGELHEAPALTLRTSILGYEPSRKGVSLVEWFLAQEDSVKGYTRAIYSGLPTSEHARILTEYVLPNPDLNGLYQVAAKPISKFELLGLIARIYKKDIEIIPDELVTDNKTMSAAKFAAKTGYVAPAWEELIEGLYSAWERF